MRVGYKQSNPHQLKKLPWYKCCRCFPSHTLHTKSFWPPCPAESESASSFSPERSAALGNQCIFIQKAIMAQRISLDSQTNSRWHSPPPSRSIHYLCVQLSQNPTLRPTPERYTDETSNDHHRRVRPRYRSAACKYAVPPTETICTDSRRTTARAPAVRTADCP